MVKSFFKCLKNQIYAIPTLKYSDVPTPTPLPGGVYEYHHHHHHHHHHHYLGSITTTTTRGVTREPQDFKPIEISIQYVENNICRYFKNKIKHSKHLIFDRLQISKN